LILDFDNLKNDPESVLQRVYQFLGLATVDFPQVFKVNNPTVLQSASEASLRNSIIGSLLGYLPEFVRRSGKSVLSKLTPPEKRLLTLEERAFVLKAIGRDVRLFGKEYQFDVEKWGF
jgi:hypothetical protein